MCVVSWRRSWYLLQMQMPLDHDQVGSSSMGWSVVLTSLLTAVLALTSVSLMTAAIATDSWVTSSPKLQLQRLSGTPASVVGGNRRTTSSTAPAASNDPSASPNHPPLFTEGYVNFGLFHGYKRLDNGLGPRYGELWVHCIAWRNLCGWEWSWMTTTQHEMDKNPSAAAAAATDDDASDDKSDKAKDVVSRLLYTIDDSIRAYDDNQKKLRNDSSSTPAAAAAAVDADERRRYSSTSDFGLFNCGLWASTVAFVILSIVSGLVLFVLALLNIGLSTVLGKLIRPAWVFAWTSILESSIILAIITYAVLFGTNFQHNILTRDDKELYMWTTAAADNSTTNLDLSFYLVVAAAILNCICMVVSCIPLLDCTKCRRIKESKSAMDGIIMMY